MAIFFFILRTRASGCGVHGKQMTAPSNDRRQHASEVEEEKVLLLQGIWDEVRVGLRDMVCH